ncbi:hypothetical protein F5Y14DRAFT_449580 [Nemania sp. NC0429]|nr:hypothetical protein F5Y14DRAFT_449580 [Nemania sp. NC0429]
MRITVLKAIIVCLAGRLGAAAATNGGVGNKIILPAAHHAHAHSSHHLMGHALQHQARYLPEPPNGPVYRCHDPHPEIFGPAPPVEDCNNVIKQFAALTTTIDVKLVEGCYQIVSGNCTGLVCPQRLGESTISGALAAQYMATPLRDECIAKGSRGWWMDGQGLGIGVYLT